MITTEKEQNIRMIERKNHPLNGTGLFCVQKGFDACVSYLDFTFITQPDHVDEVFFFLSVC